MMEEIHKDTDGARAGSTPHIVRYVLGVSLSLIVIAFAVVLIWGMGPTSHSG